MLTHSKIFGVRGTSELLTKEFIDASLAPPEDLREDNWLSAEPQAEERTYKSVGIRTVFRSENKVLDAPSYVLKRR